MNFWGLGRKKACRTVASSSAGQSLQVGVVMECETHLHPRFTEEKAGVRLWWCYPESSKYKDEVSVDAAGVSIHFRTFVKSLFLFPCAETINKLPSFTRALHHSQILDKRHIVWTFQRGKRLRKDTTPIYFPWAYFLCLVLNTDNCPEPTLPASATVHILGVSYLFVQWRQNLPTWAR